jgi:hypothetical protein
MKRIKQSLKHFFFPPAGSPRWLMILPYAILGVLTLLLLVGGAYTWDYSNSPKFCGTTCHTMPPQNVTYLVSPHANVYCTECHIGRGFLGQQFSRKTEDVYEIYAMLFHQYEFPIRASRTRPARETCEKCHQPEAFVNDSLSVITHFGNDLQNASETIYLVLKTGGGAKREGLGRGIHWHIVNRVLYYTTDPLSQDIPYVRVYNDDGTTTEYTTAGFDPKSIDEDKLKEMDCLTCHNRVSHNFEPPAESVDSAMTRGLIDPNIPEIHEKAVMILSASYASRDEAVKAITALADYYKNSHGAYYSESADKVQAAIQVIQDIYDHTVFTDQKVDWTTYPNDLGHIDSPGCFRCHDGKHPNANEQAIRLECNLCHSIPIVSTPHNFVTRLEISSGPEPASHRDPLWIGTHYIAYSLPNATCTNCHITTDAGGISNTSFCSNSACHGTVFNYIGLDALSLRKTLPQAATPAPTPTPAPATGPLTFDATIKAIFAAHCTGCHNATAPTAGLNLTSYAGVMNGGSNGPVIIPGDGRNSLLVKIQSAQHFANLASDELSLVKQWIEAGAPEK